MSPPRALTILCFVVAVAASPGLAQTNRPASTVPPAAASVPATARVGALGSPAAIEFEGNASFTASALREGLTGTPEFLLAAHPAAPVAGFMEAIRLALVRGYRNNGFPDAQVAVEPDATRQKVVAKIVEGPRYLTGEVRVEGAGEVPAADIVRALSEPAQTSNVNATLDRAIESALRLHRSPATEQQAAEEAKKFGAQLPSANVPIGSPPLTPPGANSTPASSSVSVGPGTAGLPNPIPGQPNLMAVMFPSAESTSPLWAPGEPVPFRESFPEEIATQVRTLFAARGHPLATVKARLEPDAATRRVRLALDVSEGPRAVIGRLDVRGHRVNTRDEILQFVALTSGGEATPAALGRAKLALWNSARFYHFDLTATPRGPQSREIDVAIEVEENPKLPPLREPLSRLDAALVRFANHFTTQTARRDLGIALSDQDRSLVTIGISPDKGFAAYASGDGGAKFGLEFGRHGSRALAAASGRTAGVEFSRVPVSVTATLWFLTGPDREKSGRHSDLSAGIGWSALEPSGALVDLNLIIAPSFACEEGTKDNTSVFENGEVRLVSRGGRTILRFQEETGALIEWDLAAHRAGSDDGGARIFRVAKILPGGSALAEATQAIQQAWPPPTADGAPRESFARLLFNGPWADQLFKAWGEDAASTQALLGRSAVAAQLLEFALGSPELAGWFRSEDKPEEKSFTIPIAPDSAASPSVVAGLFAANYYKLAAAFWPEDSWPTKFTRELFYVLTGNTRYTDTVMDELFRDASMGPLGSVLVAQLLRRVNPTLAWRFAHRALGHGTAEDFRQDWRLLLDAQTKAGRIAQDVVRQLGELSESEIAELTAMLSAAESGVVRRALSDLRAKKDSPVTEVLQPFLDQWWNEHMRPDLENRIGAMMAGDTPVDAAMTAFTVNGEPVSRKFLNLATRNAPVLAWVPRRAPPAGTPAPAPVDRAREALIAVTLAQLSFREQAGLVKDEFLDQKIAEEVRSVHGGDRQKFNAELTRQSLTPADHRELLRLREIFEFIRTQATNDVPPPTESEIAAALRGPLPAVAERRHLRAIGVPKSASGTPAPRERAELIRTQAQQDGNFDQVWARHDSKDPALPRRFEIPNVLRTDLKKEIADAAFALETGAISPVIESDDLFYVLYLVKKDAHDSPAEKRRQATTVAANLKRTTAFPRHLDQLRAGAIVRRFDDPAPKATNVPPPAPGTRLEFESLTLAANNQTRVSAQSMERFTAPARWSGGSQAFCLSSGSGWAEWEFTVSAAGDYRLDLLATRAANFCQVQPAVDGKDLGAVLELVAPTVQPTGPIRLGTLHLTAGVHRFRCTVTGQHASSTGYAFGLDALDLVSAKLAPDSRKALR